MCGFVGFWRLKGFDNQERDRQLLGQMLKRIAHRGPDDSGEWIDPNNGFAVGHQRLSVIDTSDGGHQPMESGCGRFVLAFNGEIYNFRDIRALLQSKGVVFKSNSDTEVLLEGYSLLGSKIWSMLDGMFAVAIYDQLENRVVLARDRIGEKPLYWGCVNHTFAFSSELRPLMLISELDLEIDHASVALYFLYRYVPHPRSILKNIYKLEPGKELNISRDGQVKMREWYRWEVEPYEGKLSDQHFKAICQPFKDQLCASIERRLISDVPIGLFLSGGIDSGLVAAICSRSLGRSLKTFSFGSEDNPNAEHHVANQLSMSLGHDSNVYTASRNDLVKSMMLCGEELDEPLGDRSLISQRLISSFARESVTVCLSGDGGDELFGGYSRYQNSLIKEVHRNNLFVDSFAFEYFSTRLSVLPLENILLAFNDVRHSIKASLEDLYLLSTPPRIDALHVMRSYDLLGYLPGAVLSKVDRASMGVALESRTPFLSPEILALSEKLPSAYCIANIGQKAILRYILSTLLTKSEQELILNRPKQGFGVGSELFSSGSDDIAFESTASMNKLIDVGLFSPNSDSLRWFQKGLKNYNAIWAMIVFGQWIGSLTTDDKVSISAIGN
jgi:asparagine synthase (glutamine-hydrolysing)